MGSHQLRPRRSCTQIGAPDEARRRMRTIPPRNDTQSSAKRDGVDERLTDPPAARMEPPGPAFGRPDDKLSVIRDQPRESFGHSRITLRSIRAT